MVSDLTCFLSPRSVAVIGATSRPGSWGSFIMNGLLAWGFKGKIFPVNHKAAEVYGIPAFKDVKDIPEPVDLAVFTIPEEHVEEALLACGQKQVKGITLITAGYGEAIQDGKEKEKHLAALAHTYGMRILGPNISGTFNLHVGFNAAASPSDHLCPTNLAAVCQGGYAFYELLASGFSRGMGVGKFIHTGNECDLTITDFLEHFGQDPEVQAILMYLETIRDGRRFMEVARQVTSRKPVIAFKAGKTRGGARAASSHTGALAGRRELFQGLLTQLGIIVSPTMEILLPLGHALVERPPMKDNRVGIVTMGGSWGVVLTDALEEQGLSVIEFSPSLQVKLRAVGMPVRASTRNPVDVGASALFLDPESMIAIGRAIALSGEVDALILHGIGSPGMQSAETPPEMVFYLEIQKRVMGGYNALEQESGIPVLIGNHFSPWESQAVWDLNGQGIRIYNRIDDIAHLLRLMHAYWGRKKGHTPGPSESPGGQDIRGPL